jgi:glycosyltransferase involved in cell wall biosynthesis
MEFPLDASIALIPAFNAELSIAELIAALRQTTRSLRVLVVDDGSADKTGDIAAAAGAMVVRHETNRGKGAALQTGFDHIRGLSNIDFIITMDADLQHCPEDVLKLFAAQRFSNADIVVGRRNRIGAGMPIARILSNTITSALVGMRTGCRISDSQCGFRLIGRRVLESVRLESSGFEAETEFLIKSARQGFRIEFTPVRTVYAREKSHMAHWTTTVNFIKVLFREYP